MYECMYMYVCTVCVYVCICGCTYVCMNACMYVCIPHISYSCEEWNNIFLSFCSNEMMLMLSVGVYYDDGYDDYEDDESDDDNYDYKIVNRLSLHH